MLLLSLSEGSCFASASCSILGRGIICHRLVAGFSMSLRFCSSWILMRMLICIIFSSMANCFIFIEFTVARNYGGFYEWVEVKVHVIGIDVFLIVTRGIIQETDDCLCVKKLYLHTLNKHEEAIQVEITFQNILISELLFLWRNKIFGWQMRFFF